MNYASCVHRQPDARAGKLRSTPLWCGCTAARGSSGCRHPRPNTPRRLSRAQSHPAPPSRPLCSPQPPATCPAAAPISAAMPSSSRLESEGVSSLAMTKTFHICQTPPDHSVTQEDDILSPVSSMGCKVIKTCRHLSGPMGWPGSEMSSEISEAVAVLGGSLALSLIFDRDARAACAATAAGGPAHSIHAHSHIFDGFQY